MILDSQHPPVRCLIMSLDIKTKACVETSRHIMQLLGTSVIRKTFSKEGIISAVGYLQEFSDES